MPRPCRQTALRLIPASVRVCTPSAVAAIDAAGNGSKTVTTKIGVDTKAPTKTWTFNRPTVKRGAYSVMKYEVYDPLPSCGLAKVHLVVYTTKWKLVRKVNLGTVATNKVKSYRLKNSFKAGHYWWGVVATDIAGNACPAAHEWLRLYTVR